ncbi:Prophage antirepressor [Anaerosporobacter mobilis DSM 15930]|jgi:prophage antirepressor-like protein|uniref:Prophage antirepressor n=1 Tax=Anaerosporobacter mobilis DSM 15930 TaxID=1120996 RepID=A0A1M7NCJ5_9FIRM|nr:BRO family protein [Anaerosporobacter mobilis]SHN01436.1 Prophage antirepressor [Anaerosporobacter mobilis DSM 15930]
MNDLKIFTSAEFGQVRTVTINEEPYFVGTDVATILGYAKPQNAIATHVDKDDTLKQGITDSLGRIQDTTIINESGLYALIFGSKLESAKRFKKWVTSKVLPDIRKNGTYQKPLTTQEIMREQLTMIDNVSDRVTALENNMTIDYSQQLALEKLVNKQVIDALGGKETNAYKEISRKVFTECNRDIKNYFNVNSRNNIAVIDFDKARQFIQNWKPCYTTQLFINDCNQQMCIN